MTPNYQFPKVTSILQPDPKNLEQNFTQLLNISVPKID